MYEQEKPWELGLVYQSLVQIFSILFIKIEWSRVLALDYNKRCSVDLALLFCNNSQEMDWKTL